MPALPKASVLLIADMEVGGGMNSVLGLFYIHHIEEHQSGMFIFFLLGQFLKNILAIKVNSRKIGINSDVTKGGLILSDIKAFLQFVHQPAANALPAMSKETAKRPTLMHG